MTGPSAFAVMFTPRATRELLAAVRWWREHRAQASRLLDEEIERTLQRIAMFPRIAPKVIGRDARRAVLPRSGDVMLYRIRPRLARIEVMSVVHGRRA